MVFTSFSLVLRAIYTAYYPPLCRWACLLFHLEIFECKAYGRIRRLEKPLMAYILTKAKCLIKDGGNLTEIWVLRIFCRGFQHHLSLCSLLNCYVDLIRNWARRRTSFVVDSLYWFDSIVLHANYHFLDHDYFRSLGKAST